MCTSYFLAAFGPQLAQVLVQATETLLPGRAIVLDPVRHILEPGWLEPTRAPLRPPGLRDQAGLLQDFEVLGHRRQAELEWLRELEHRRLALGQAGQDRAARG